MPTSSQSGAGCSRCLTRAISSFSETSASPPLLRIVDGASLADDGDFDLSRIFELVLDSSGDVLREPDRFFVGDLLAFDHDADLAPRLQRERLGHAFERVGDALELFETLDVAFEDVAPRPRSCRRD